MKTCPTCQSTYPDDYSLCPRDGAPLATQATETETQLAAGLSRRFRIIRQLGKGGMGTVFLAEQIGVGNRHVALKVLNRKLLDDPDFLIRFQNEAGSTGRIRHPNVVTIFESGQGDDGTPYIAMDFLEGESLREVLKQRGALPLSEVAEILQQAARGLNAAHKLGIIHRDLKPDNIFLTHNDEGELIVKVVDFGIAKLRESSSHTMTGTVLGTPAYMSFEQASGMRSDELDARSDIYSLGVVVYEMLTGRLPFHSDTPVGYLRKHLMEEPPPFRTIAQGLGVSPAVETSVMKALAKDRNKRFTSALDFASELTGAAHASPPAESLVTVPRTRIVLPPPVIAQVKAESAIQIQNPAPPTRIVESPSVQPQRGQIVMAMTPQLRTASEPPGKMKGVAIAVSAVILVASGFWYFSRLTNPPVVKPPVEHRAPQTETVHQNSPVETPAPTSSRPIESKVATVDRRKSGRIVIQTSPNAHVYLNGVFKGQARPQGRMVIEDVKPGFLALRVSLEGKQDYEQKVAVLAGQEVLVAAQLEDVVPPKEVVVPPKEVVVPPTGGVPEKANPTFSIETPTTLSDTRGVDFGPYLIRINNIVRRNWLSVIPEPARLGEKGRVGVVFEILKNGSAPQVRLVASSGSDPLDQAAVKGIQASVPFPPLPQEFTGNHLVLQFVFLYNLTTQSGGDF